jgi:hypothetical protein
MSPGLHTTVAETLVPADRPAAYAAAGRLVERLWAGRTETVTAEAPALLVHTVTTAPGGDDVDAWVTWQLTPAASHGWTRVRLTCDEADTSAAPPPELDAVLTLLLEEVGVQALC